MVHKRDDVAGHVVDGEVAVVRAVFAVAAPVERQHPVAAGEERHDVLVHPMVLVPARDEDHGWTAALVAVADRVSVERNRWHERLRSCWSDVAGQTVGLMFWVGTGHRPFAGRANGH